MGRAGRGWRAWVRGLLGVGLAWQCWAEPPPVTAPPAALKPFAFAGPEVTRVDWNTRNLVAADLNGDGRQDLALLNNSEARITLLIQRADPTAAPLARKPGGGQRRWEPILEDARFDRQGLVTGMTMYALAVGDLNGDGRPDLACSGIGDALTVRFQDAAGQWAQGRVFEQDKPSPWPGTLLIAELTGDQRADLLLLGAEAVLLWRQDEQGVLHGPSRYPLADRDAYAPRLRDVDGDGQLDLLYQVPNHKFSLRLRRNLQGEFGPELLLRADPWRGDLESVGQGPDSLVFAGIQDRGGLLECFTLSPRDREDRLSAVVPRTYATGADTHAELAWVLADLDGDGKDDLVMAERRAPRLVFFRQLAGGRFQEAQHFPSVSDIRDLAAIRLTPEAPPVLVVASAAERSLGLVRLTPEGRLSYPEPLPTVGAPELVRAGKLTATAPESLIYLSEAEGQRALRQLRQEADGTWTTQVLPGAEFKTMPRLLLLADLDQDSRLDILVGNPSETPRLLWQQADGSWQVPEPSAARLSLLEPWGRASWTLADITGDGQAELLVAGRGFARALRLDAKGVVQVVDQFNAREPEAELSTALAWRANAEAPLDLLLADRRSESLQRLRRGADGVYRYTEALELSPLDLVGAVTRDLDGDGHGDLLLLARDRFWWLPLPPKELAVNRLSQYESDLEDQRYGLLRLADLNGDGTPDLLAVDNQQSRIMEFLVGQPATGWRSHQHFTIFDSDPHFRGRRGANLEPREVLVTDLTGDGRQDIVLMIHDRILVYPGKE